MAENITVVIDPKNHKPMIAFRDRDAAMEWACKHTDVTTHGVTWDSCLFIDEIVDYNPPEASPLTCVDAYGEVV